MVAHAQYTRENEILNTRDKDYESAIGGATVRERAKGAIRGLPAFHAPRIAQARHMLFNPPQRRAVPATEN
jgi:hypothetical protein